MVSTNNGAESPFATVRAFLHIYPRLMPNNPNPYPYPNPNPNLYPYPDHNPLPYPYSNPNCNPNLTPHFNPSMRLQEVVSMSAATMKHTDRHIRLGSA